MSRIALLMALCALAASAQAPKGEGKKGGGAPPAQPQMIQQIKPGFYVVTGAGGNTGVRVTKQGLIVVDTKNLGDPFYNALMEQIKTVSTQPVLCPIECVVGVPLRSYVSLSWTYYFKK